MATTKPIPREEALAFTGMHWPSHNRRQGIEWEQSNYALGAFEGDELCAAAYYKVVGGMAHLEQIVVAEERTHEGLGTALMAAFESHVAELGCHVIQLETAETQAPAFYERLGYERVGTYPNGRFHLAWHLYRKALSPEG